MLWGGSSSSGAGLALSVIGGALTLPFFLAINITARRRRSATGADRPHSVELHAANTARGGAFGDSLIILPLATLGLAAVPTLLPALWGALALTAVVASFWIRYTLTLRGIRG